MIEPATLPLDPPTMTTFTDAAQTWNRRFEGADFLFGTEPNV